MEILEVIKEYIQHEIEFIQIDRDYTAAIKNYIYNECRGWPAFIEEAKSHKMEVGKIFAQADTKCSEIKKKYRLLASNMSDDELYEIIDMINEAKKSIEQYDIIKIYNNICEDLNYMIDERKTGKTHKRVFVS